MILDIIVAVFITSGFYIGYRRGIIKTVLDAVSLIVGVAAALKLSPITINLLEDIIKVSPALTFIAGIIITFMVVMLLIRYLGRKMESALEALRINFVNKILGGTFQAVFFAYLLSMGIMLLNTIQVLNPEAKTSSMTYPVIEPLAEKGSAIFVRLKPLFAEFWNKTTETMEEIKSQKKD
jgi:membrane protein required for colicin V production